MNGRNRRVSVGAGTPRVAKAEGARENYDVRRATVGSTLVARSAGT